MAAVYNSPTQRSLMEPKILYRSAIEQVQIDDLKLQQGAQRPSFPAPT